MTPQQESLQAWIPASPLLRVSASPPTGQFGLQYAIRGGMETLSETQVGKWIARSIPASAFRGKRVLLIVPDATRTAPLPLLFHTLHELLAPVTARLSID